MIVRDIFKLTLEKNVTVARSAPACLQGRIIVRDIFKLTLEKNLTVARSAQRSLQQSRDVTNIFELTMKIRMNQVEIKEKVDYMSVNFTSKPFKMLTS